MNIVGPSSFRKVASAAVLGLGLAACGGGSAVGGPVPAASTGPGTGGLPFPTASPAGTPSPAPAASGSPASGASASPSPNASASSALPTASPGVTPTSSSTPGSAGSASPAATGSFAPLLQPGPALDVSAAALSASLACSGSLAPALHAPVLLVPGTDTIPSVDFDWNYERAFTASGIPWCAVTLPASATGDIQVAGEYVVSAIRTMYAQTGAKIDVLGWSQGGMVPRFALRFWPDTRAMVDDVAALAPSNHGTTLADGSCMNSCTAANWQQRSAANSHFIMALNSYAETFASISYTDVYSHNDEIVQPNLDASGSSSLHTGAGAISNVAVQDVCPSDTADHLALGTYDAVGYALVLDAFTHAGPADPTRVPLTVCAQQYQPGVDPTMAGANYARLLQYIGAHSGDSPALPAEPALAPYVFAR